jgi:fatty acid-binding protein DegV
MAGVAVVVDSGASLPVGTTCQARLHVVPMRVTLGERTYLDGSDLTPSDFYRML